MTHLLDGLRGRRKAACFLLGKGVRVRESHCTLCERELGSPRHNGYRFSLGVAAEPAKTGGLPPIAGRRLFLDTGVLVTGVNSHLVSMLKQGRNFLGAKVMAAEPAPTARRGRRPYLFCLRCGLSVIERVSANNQTRYSWDWLAEMEPRGLIGRWRTGLSRLRPRWRREPRPRPRAAPARGWRAARSAVPASLLQMSHPVTTGVENR
jgi:hypothetical protein